MFNLWIFYYAFAIFDHKLGYGLSGITIKLAEGRPLTLKAVIEFKLEFDFNTFIAIIG